MTKDGKTELYSEGDDSSGEDPDPEKTSAYPGDSPGTESLSPGAPVDARVAPGELAPGSRVQLKNKSYEILDLIAGPEAGAEGTVYKIRDEENHELALKLYHEFSDPREEPNGEALRRIKGIQNEDILPLIEYGIGSDRYENRCWEISAYAKGGDLLAVPEKDFREVYAPNSIRFRILPEILRGIAILHEHQIYHCDLKPRNVFYLDQEKVDLVIGDYGSAKTFEESSGRDLAHTFMSKGTSFYLAPEQARGVISEKNDYYSLGMILLHLL